jgi:hypothetical protein
MRKVFVALIASAALNLGLIAAPATAEPPENACHGRLLVSFVHEFGSARAAAEHVIGDNPHAVQLGQQAIREQCAFLAAG